MPSLRDSMMGLALGAVVVVGAVTAMARNGRQTVLQNVGASELAVAQAAASYITASTASTGSTPTSVTVSGLVSDGYLPSSYSSGLSPVGGPLEIRLYRESGGGNGVLVYTEFGNGVYAMPNSNLYDYMNLNAHLCAGLANGSFSCYLGAIQGKLSNYGVSPPSNNAMFAPMAWDWVPAAPIQSSNSAASAIANLQPGQSYTDSAGNTFTAYASSSGTVIYVPANVTGAYLWFPQSVFSESSPSLSGFHVPSGTGTNDTGEGPYSLSTNGSQVDGYWNGELQIIMPISDFG